MFSFLRKNKDKVHEKTHDAKSHTSAHVSAMSSLQQFRTDFPVLCDGAGENKKEPLIYVDNACMSLRPQVVIDAISQYYTTYSSCAGRSNHRLSRELDGKVRAARLSVAKFIGAKHDDEIIFTRNATESLNLVAQSLSFDVGDIVLTSHKEHNSNLVPWLVLVKQKGIVHQVINADSHDSFYIEQLEQLLADAKKRGRRVRLVSVGHVSNLDGSSLDISAIVACAHKYGAQVLVDGCQAVGHMPVDVSALGVDYYVFSAHKMCGPSGMGALYATRSAQEKLSQFLVGGQTVSQTTYTSFVAQSGPSKFEAGLQDYAGILGFGVACDYLRKIGLEKIESHVVALNEQLTLLLKDEISDEKIRLLGPRDAHKRGGVFSFVVPHTSQTEFASLLDKTYGIAVRGGQHCVHSWFAANNLEGSVRVSLYFYNTMHEVEQIASAIKSLLRLHNGGMK